MPNTAKVIEGQSLLDWCLVNTGAVSTLFNVMDLNGLTSIEVETGTVLQIPSVLKQNVVDFFAEKQLSTGIIEEITGGFSNTTVTVELLNTLDQLVSTHSFAIGSGTQQVTIPDTTLNLNGSTFLDVHAGVTTNIELRDEEGATLEPLSVVDNVISVNTTTGGGVTVLPSGTYIPVNSGVDAFDLIWENQTTDVTTAAGTITLTAGPGAFNKGAIAKVDHNGDFELRFKKDFDSSFSGFVGLSHFHAFMGYTNLDFSFYFIGSTDLQCWQKGVPVPGSAASGLTALSQFRIKRVGNKIQYYVDAILIVEAEIINTGPMNIDFGLNSLHSITDIEIIIP